MSVGPFQLVLIILIIVLLFGTKKLGNIGSDLGKAIRGFKKGMSDDDKDDEASKLKADAPAADAKRESESEQSSHEDAGR